MLDFVFTLICSCHPSFLQLIRNKSRKKLLGFNQRHHYISMRISFKEELLLNLLGQNFKNTHCLLGQTFFDEGIFFFPTREGIKDLRLFPGYEFINLLDQSRKLRNEFHDSLGNDYNTVIHALRRSLFNRIRNIIRNFR